MKINIFNVGHGGSALVTAPNRNLMLIDCGRDADFAPSAHLERIGCTGIEHLFITNFDHDHVADLPSVLKFGVSILSRNGEIPAATLRRMKEEGGPLSDALKAALHLNETYTAPAPTINFAGVTTSTFNHQYPTFTDTNNLSLVVFVKYGRFKILFPGDIEEPAWRLFLQDPSFAAELAGTDILVASHHGRESGYCAGIFQYFTPALVIVSDKGIVHDTQKVDYSRHARGVRWNGGPEVRKVLTTRNDDHIVLQASEDGSFRVTVGLL